MSKSTIVYMFQSGRPLTLTELKASGLKESARENNEIMFSTDQTSCHYVIQTRKWLQINNIPFILKKYSLPNILQTRSS